MPNEEKWNCPCGCGGIAIFHVNVPMNVRQFMVHVSEDLFNEPDERVFAQGLRMSMQKLGDGIMEQYRRRHAGS